MIVERQLQALRARINILEDQLKLAGITLREQKRLYNLGRADFDQVLRSENELINAQVALVNNLSTFFQIQVLKYKIYGETMSYLTNFKG